MARAISISGHVHFANNMERIYGPSQETIRARQADIKMREEQALEIMMQHRAAREAEALEAERKRIAEENAARANPKREYPKSGSTSSGASTASAPTPGPKPEDPPTPPDNSDDEETSKDRAKREYENPESPDHGGHITNALARRIAKKLGYEETLDYPFNSHGRLVFKKGNIFITPDRDGHIGGFWKMFRRRTRIGTFCKYLKRMLGH